ncbi:hypothetical protein C1637_02660 [Chryseobacterium lactis]|uniref:PorT family protein n=1 Tax=Chryseobacterium lactis TaxID=1241981 RepID=A0A3G6RNE3_CHRLC|nr:outer membrane beta-barrel protein [Chryseobacterium lactis]AZA81493.1 PorT family protein [Chryseobacterium lactis]AZB06491.1 PorT family protein [Chryseobacterium lactis]PNW15342.1 hypothetical protein C1637_02660 [Chryseobacterium lactis]
MNNEWLNNLRSRMEDHEEDVPDGLWDDIRDDLFSENDENMIITDISSEAKAVEKPKGDVRRNEVSRSLIYRIGGIAAAIALLFLMLKTDWSNDNTNQKLSQKKTDLKKESREHPRLKNAEEIGNSIGLENANSGISVAENILNAIVPEKIIKHRSLKNSLEQGIHQIANIQEIKTADVAQKGVQENKTPESLPLAQEKINDEPAKTSENEILFTPEKTSEKYAENTRHKDVKSRKGKTWMLSMLAGNASSNAAEQQFPGYASITGKPMNIQEVWTATTYDDNPLTEILLANQSQPVEARIRHKVPVTFGLSLYYNLGKKWGIGTGLNYTKLASELHSGSNANYIKSDQSVHYIGIPVQVNYNVIQKGRFTGYVTGGALVEKPVAGSITTTYVVNDEVKETSKENLEHKPLQFSVSTAVGFQLKVIDKLGIYAEPGVGYHFKDENAPNTIYKEKPLHFNVKFGLRLLLD